MAPRSGAQGRSRQAIAEMMDRSIISMWSHICTATGKTGTRASSTSASSRPALYLPCGAKI